MSVLPELAYLCAAFLFILGLKFLSSPVTARRGNLLSSAGMLLAVVVTLLHREIIDYRWILVGLAVGAVIGSLAARLIAMTSMPEMVALFNGSGGLASLLVAWHVYHTQEQIDLLTAVTVVASVGIGGITFTGSLVAWGKLSGRLGGRPWCFPGRNVITSAVLIVAVVLAGGFCLNPGTGVNLFHALLVVVLILGILFVTPIGGGDMPVVISLLNSYSGLAACATGFVLQMNVLIVTGSLVGASGLILTRLMCKAMNRSLANVLFSGFGSVVKGKQGDESVGEVSPINVEDAGVLLEAAASVVIVPGYGLAVAQAQHAVRELAEQLESNGTEVRYAIHPVAGRMPGHMNVLLAEANVPYDQFVEMDTINATMDTIDLCLVVGANDVVNPAAHEDSSSPIYGMPIVDVEKARNVIVLKRSMAAGFAGIDNHLFYKENTRMLFGDAKVSLQGLKGELAGMGE